MIRLPIILLILNFAVTAMASESHHGEQHGPPTSLIYYTINLLILIAILVYFGKDSVVKLFQARYDEFHRQAKEAATIKQDLEEQKHDFAKRLAELQATKETSLLQAKREAQEFYDSELRNANENAQRILADAGGQAQAEEKKMIEKLRMEALEQAVAAAEQELEKVEQKTKTKMNQQFAQRVKEATL